MPETLTFGETEYIELWGNGHPIEVFNARGEMQETTRVYLVDWEDRQQAVLDFLGYATAEQPAAGNNYCYLSRQIPHYHADYKRPSDQDYFLYADQVTIEPMGIPVDEEGNPLYGNESTLSDDETPVYHKAKLTVHYSARGYRILEDYEMPQATDGYPYLTEAGLERYCEILSHPAAEYLSITAGTFTFGPNPVDVTNAPTGVTAGRPAEGAPGKIVGTDDLTILWRQVPRRMVAKASVMAPVLGGGTQLAAFDYAIGRVNNATFLGFPAETLLCEPMEITPWIQADGEMVFDITFHFKYLRTGHNYYLTPNANSQLVYSQLVCGKQGNYVPGAQADGQATYDAYDFDKLFYGYDYTAGKAP